MSQQTITETALLRQPGLLACLVGRNVAAFSSQVQAVAVGWQIYALTHSAAALGFVGLMQFLPMVALIFPAGHVADHFNRRRIVMTCQLIETCSAAVMAVASFEHVLGPWGIYAMVMVFGACRAFEMPAQQTFLPSLVPAALFPKAAALSSSLFQVASIAGPSLGGVLYGLGADICYALCAVAFGTSAVATGLMQLRFTARPKQPVTLQSVFGGIAFLRRKPAMLGAISLDLFAVLLGGATALLPLYADTVLHAGSIGLGLLRAGPAIGAVLMAAILTRWPLNRRAGRVMFLSVAIFGVATIVFGLSHSVPLSVFALMVLGAADVVSVMVRGALVQLGTPDEMRGRVSAVNMLFIGSSNQLGEFESGMLASAIGAVPAVVLGGVGTLIVTVLWMRLFPGLRDLDRLDEIESD
ncbi:MFS transporter [Acetobacter fallax]|uniref:MFS transporter n=1 Tax=Acetobacter fallax TaxID=1737473 RepID=A0ABX0K9D6_9PROT|nr:MFS transporter [Acetobacter fallax]NHO33004.1 MFS transporter [Acetobacter fallax]NHO36628.1 MFS transporter [Acetobacter fallax]